jgi:hypothetical protein
MNSDKLFTEQQSFSMSRAKNNNNIFNSKLLDINDQYHYTMDQTDNSERILSIEKLRDKSPSLHLEVFKQILISGVKLHSFTRRFNIKNKSFGLGKFC